MAHTQLIEFAVKAQLTYIQGCIVKYISNYKCCNSRQDINNAIELAKLAIELNAIGPELPSIGLAYNYCKANKFSSTQTNIIVSTVKEDYSNVIRYCNQLIKQEYLLT